MPFVNELVHDVADRIAGNYEAIPNLVSEGKRLLENWFQRGLRVDVINQHGRTLLFSLGRVPQMSSLLIQQGLDVNAKDQYGDTALDIILGDFYGQLGDEIRSELQMERLNTIEELIGYGALLGKDSTPPRQYLLLEAVRENHLNLVKVLLKRGYDLHIRDAEGHTLWDIANRKGFWELGQLLENARN
jgi:ankyrin repeat protein